MTSVFTAVAYLLPTTAFDWNVFFGIGNIPVFYPPWTMYITGLLTYQLLVGITLSSFALAVMKRAKSPVSAAMAFITLPLFWAIFLGQLDGLALLGVSGLPYLVPLAMLKPQVASFAVFANKKSMLAAAIFLLITFVVWGAWPLEMLNYHRDHSEWPQDIALGLLGLIPLSVITLAMLTSKIPRNDPDWWMLIGACLTPALIPYNMLPLMPAIARLPTKWAIAVALTSWLPLSANWIGPTGWHLGWLSLLIMGIGLKLKAIRAPYKIAPRNGRIWSGGYCDDKWAEGEVR